LRYLARIFLYYETAQDVIMLMIGTETKDFVRLLRALSGKFIPPIFMKQSPGLHVLFAAFIIFVLPLPAGAETLIRETFEQTNSAHLEDYGIHGLSGTYSKPYLTTGTGANGWKTQLVLKPISGGSTVIRAYGSSPSEATNFGYWLNFSEFKQMSISVDIQPGDASFAGLILGATHPVGSGTADAGFFVRIQNNGTVAILPSGGGGPQYTFTSSANTGWNSSTVQVDYTLTATAPYTATFYVRVNGSLLPGPGAGGSFVRTGLTGTSNFVANNYIWFNTGYPGSGVKSATYDNIVITDGAPIVGAIRWDAWTGGSITAQVERDLGPQKYHFRLPWFSEVDGDGLVHINGGTQAVMDQEISYAAAAGLNYWMFLLYPEDNVMSQGLKNYLQSGERDRINFCVCLHNAIQVPAAQWPAELARTVALLKEPGYQTVLGGRPLVYAFNSNLVDNPQMQQRFAEFLQAARAAGLNPYCVFMGWSPATDYPKAVAAGFDAVSNYARAANDSATFTGLCAGAETAFWQNARGAGARYVPLVTTGWDKQPRVDNPVSWEAPPPAGLVWAATATPEEIAAHLERALTFVRENPETCEANAIIIYAWNEHDEGGWLCPTWTASGADASRIYAISSVLKGMP
jgi:hypothetical protein